MNETNLKSWYEEVLKIAPIYEINNTTFVIYKGFKLSKNDNLYKIQDVRFSNMYTQVSKRDMKTLVNNGVTKGVDTIGFYRDKKRISYYKKAIERLYQKRKVFKKLIPENRRLNEKRIRNINKQIDEYLDLMFFYKTRNKQFNIKYNLK